MKLNIQIIDSKEPKTIPVDKLKTGTVYRIQDKNGPILLRIQDSLPLILTYSSGSCWLELGQKGDGGFANEPAVEILGQLTGIEVTK